MTTNTERKPVDVLALLAAPIEHAAKFGAPRGFVSVNVDTLREARAAVAELIEAAREVNRKGSGGNDWTGHADAFAALDRLRAALARVGGA